MDPSTPSSINIIYRSRDRSRFGSIPNDMPVGPRWIRDGSASKSHPFNMDLNVMLAAPTRIRAGPPSKSHPVNMGLNVMLAVPTRIRVGVAPTWTRFVLVSL